MNKFSAPEEIETESNDPYYLDIANQLREQLLSGKFKAGHRFYSIRGLIKDTGRSLPTVRSALSLLIEEGLLEARQGSGYYVTAKIEAAIIASGIPYTFLRCGFFMQNLSTTHQAEIRDRDEIAIPAGRSKTAFIDVRDIAAVAVRVLTEPIGANQTLTLTGSAALDYTTVAHILSATLGRTIRYTDPSILRYIFQQRAAGSPWGYALVLTMLYTITRFGNAAEVSPNVERILGRAPITFEQYACDNSAAWMKQATIS
mgnify:CR=1 FL=1